MSDQAACPSCGATFPDTAAFCPQCGTPHAQAPAQGAPPQGGDSDPSQAEGLFATGPRAAGTSVTEADDDRTRVDMPAHNPAGHDTTQVLPPVDTPSPGGAAPSWTTPAPSEPPAWSNPPAQEQPSWSTPPGAPQPQAGWGTSPGSPPTAAPPGPPASWAQGPAAAPGYAGAQAKAKVDNSVIGGVLGIVGGIAAIVSAFLVWIKVNFPGGEATGNGWDSSPDAKIVLAIGIAAVAVGVALFLTRHVVLRLLLLAAGVGALAVAVRDMLDVPNFGKFLKPNGAQGQSIGVGLYVVVAAGVVLLIAGAASFVGNRPTPPQHPM